MDMSEGLSIYQKRLLTCAEIVRNGKTPFDMSEWESTTGCGTAHCAVGDYCASGVSEMRLARHEDYHKLQPVFGGAVAWNAVQKHFRLKAQDAAALFIPHGSRGMVADRIEHFALHEHADALKVGYRHIGN